MKLILKNNSILVFVLTTLLAAALISAEDKDILLSPTQHQAIFKDRPECKINAMHMGDTSELPLLICLQSIRLSTIRGASLSIGYDGQVIRSSNLKDITNISSVDTDTISKLFKAFLDLGPIELERRRDSVCNLGWPEKYLRKISFDFLMIYATTDGAGFRDMTKTFDYGMLSLEKQKAVKDIEKSFLSAVGIDESKLKTLKKEEKEPVSNWVMIGGKKYSMKDGKLALIEDGQ